MFNQIKLTILFNGSFWSAYFEKYEHKKYMASKKIFFSEPTDNDIYNFISLEWNTIKFFNTHILPIQKKLHQDVNPKRRKRIASKELQNKSSITKAQATLKAEHEEYRINIKQQNIKIKKSLEKEKFNLKQLKKRLAKKGK